MKKFTLLFFATLLVSAGVLAQTQLPSASKKSDGTYTRCATMERVEVILKNNPQLRALTEQLSKLPPVTGSAGSNQRVEAIVNVPVVFHIVLPNPFLITDAVVQSQIDELNTDFSGLNPDSTNIPPAFQAVRGHSQVIRFVLAKRTPAGALTNGIERIVSNTGSNANLTVDPIKRAALGGADVWDPNSYLNYWVGNDVSGQGILGYAQFPSSGIPADDGIFCNFQSFGVSACNIAIYNKGRTLGHETGHYFGLLHIWGDETGCTGDDFRALTTVGSTCILPTTLYNPAGQGNTAGDIGDTPNQGAQTTNCPAGTATDACSPAAPGKMYQNYMDYTADACYSMFTIKQVQRMEYVLDNCRASLKTSLGGTAPAGAITLDASPVQSVNPGGTEETGCSSISYPSSLVCPGSILPKVRIRNNGLNTLNTLTVGLRVNGGAPQLVNLAPNLPSGGTLIVTFPSLAVATGTYTLKFYTTNTNGQNPDQVPGNDTLTTTISVSGGTPLPISQGFETGPFPPAGWSLFNPDGNFTWVWVSPGHNSVNSMAIDNYNNNFPGQIDELRTPKLTFSGTDSVIISFDVAHKNYTLAPYDILTVLVSTDCGATYTSVYSKSGPTLATAGASGSAYTTPVNSDWRTDRIALGGAFLASGNMIVAFRNTNEYGNNIFLDNINISQQVTRDIKPETVVSPGASECGRSIVPQVIVRNAGSAAVTAFKVGYSLNNGPNVITPFTQTIAPGASATVTLPVITANPGANTIKIFTADPVGASGTGDQTLANDTTTINFTVVTLATTPVVEGFEGAFPSPGWTVINQSGNAYTWTKRAPGNNSANSIWMNDYLNTAGDIDDLKTPAINVSSADSIVFSFDVAYRTYSATAPDSLLILISTDCGKTFTPIYRKGGTSLATVPGNLTSSYVPAAGEWRRERVAVGGAFLATGNAIFIVRGISAFGNNIWVDNINIDKLITRDLKVVSINQPSPIACNNPTSPTVTIQNAGTLAVTGFKVSYSIDNGAPATTIFTGLNLLPTQTMDVTLTPAFTPAVGTHTIKVYSSEPVASSGTGDLNTSNDTLSKTFNVVGNVPVPLTEGFESTTFPPVNWAVDNPDGSLTWERTTTAAKSGVASMVIRNFDYPTANTIDKFVSPVITSTSAFDSLFVSYDLAYKPGVQYPGSTDLNLDTLEIQVTKDCGATFTTVWKKWGFGLETVSSDSTNYASGSRFIPGANAWKNIRIYLTPFVGTSNFQVYFVAKSNKQNNLYIDNINVSGKTLPQRLKSQGYLIYPNPFTSIFRIHHFVAPTTLQSVGVYNSVGEKVWEKILNGQANTEMTVDLGKLPGGVYVVKLNYTDKTVVERIVKN